MKWKGYPISEALWEPEQAFSDDGDCLLSTKTDINSETSQKK